MTKTSSILSCALTIAIAGACDLSYEQDATDPQAIDLGDPEHLGPSCPMTFIDEVPADVENDLREHYRPLGEVLESSYTDDDGRAIHVSSGTFLDDSTGDKTVVSCHGACGDQDCTSYSGCELTGYTCSACSCGWWCDGCFCTRSVAIVSESASATSTND
jgi:hypothetical protein